MKIVFLLSFLLALNDISFYSKDTEVVIDIIELDNEIALREAIQKQNEEGGIIYINTKIINIYLDKPIELKGNSGSIIGKKQPNGGYPIINFQNTRDKGSFISLNVLGNSKFLKYLIIENSGSHGLIVSGQKNNFDHIITRYNQYSGIYITRTADSNIFNFCYSYRNCDLKGNGLNGNGFYSYGASNNIFNNCFSWDNSNNGFSSSSNENFSSSLTFKHSACWNNGNSDIFSGKYDFDNAKPLDKNMLTIQNIINSDENFEINYKYKKFNIDNAIIDGKSAAEWLDKTKSRTKGNGFQFGFPTTPISSNIKRIADKCVAFENKSKGFDNNFSKRYIGYFSNCVSFKNEINYHLPYVFKKWLNNWSWGAKKTEKIDIEETLKHPENIISSEKSFNSIKNIIIKTVYDNAFPDNINFDASIMSLKE